MSKKLIMIFLSIVLILGSFSFSFADTGKNSSHDNIIKEEAKRIETLIEIYDNQSNENLTIGSDQIKKVSLDETEEITVGGINDKQRKNVEVYVIDNKEECTKICVFDIPVDSAEENSDIKPFGTGSRTNSKNYARIEAIAKVNYSTITTNKGEIGYKVTSSGGRIKYLPNSAVIKSLATQAFGNGGYYTSPTSKLKNSGGRIYSGKKSLSVKKFSSMQTVTTSLGEKYFICDVDFTNAGSRYYVSYTLNGGKNSGSFYVQVNI